LAGTIIADYIRTDANQLSLNVGNTTFATINSSGLFSNTGTQLIAANGKISGASLVSGSVTNAAFATAANTIPRSAMTSGAVLQVLQTQKTDTFSTSSTTFVDVTGLSVSITPTSATSKILVCMTVNFSTSQHADMRIVRNSTDIAIGDSAGSRIRSTAHIYRGFTNGQYDQATSTMMWLDSPSTTSSTTYKIQIASPYSGGYVNVINRAQTDTDAGYEGRTVSTITVMEIAA